MRSSRPGRRSFASVTPIDYGSKHYELDGDRAGRMKIPVLRPDKLEIQAR
jgi:hypothetical protein